MGGAGGAGGGAGGAGVKGKRQRPDGAQGASSPGSAPRAADAPALTGSAATSASETVDLPHQAASSPMRRRRASQAEGL